MLDSIFSGRTLLLLLQAEKNNTRGEINVWSRFFFTLPVQNGLSKECFDFLKKVSDIGCGRAFVPSAMLAFQFITLLKRT